MSTVCADRKTSRNINHTHVRRRNVQIVRDNADFPRHRVLTIPVLAGVPDDGLIGAGRHAGADMPAKGKRGQGGAAVEDLGAYKDGGTARVSQVIGDIDQLGPESLLGADVRDDGRGRGKQRWQEKQG